MDEMDKMSVYLQYIWNENELSVCLQYIWNENGLHYFKLFGIEMDRMKMNCTVSNYLE